MNPCVKTEGKCNESGNNELKISFWEYSFIMNKHNQKPTEMFNKQDVTVYLTYIKILKDLNILNFRLHILEAIFKVKEAIFKVLKRSTSLKVSASF